MRNVLPALVRASDRALERDRAARRERLTGGIVP